jgi:hypothetical protein
MNENWKFRKPYIIGRFYNISQRNFGILLILGCSFKLWWNFCLDQNLVYNANGPLTDQTGCPWLESDRSAIRFQLSDWPICLYPWRSAFLIDMWGVLIGLGIPWLESDRSAIRYFQPSDWPICLFPWRSICGDFWSVWASGACVQAIRLANSKNIWIFSLAKFSDRSWPIHSLCLVVCISPQFSVSVAWLYNLSDRCFKTNCLDRLKRIYTAMACSIFYYK